MEYGLVVLGAEDNKTFVSSLTVTFNTTIIAIDSGALCHVISKICSGWYDCDFKSS